MLTSTASTLYIKRTDASPEALEAAATLALSSGAPTFARLMREAAADWRATQRQLHQTQAENSRLAATLATAHHSAARLEALAAATCNTLASIGLPRAPSSSDAAGATT